MSEEASHRCPTCDKRVEPRANNMFFPFCSKACRLADLGRWLDGGYRIPQNPSEEDLETLERATRPSEDDDE